MAFVRNVRALPMRWSMFEVFAGATVWTGFTKDDRSRRFRRPDIISRWMDLSNSDAIVLYSPVSVAEVWVGARANEHYALTNLFRALTCTPNRRRNGASGGHLPEAVGAEPWSRGRRCVYRRLCGGPQRGTVDAKPQGLPDEGSLFLRLSRQIGMEIRPRTILLVRPL